MKRRTVLLLGAAAVGTGSVAAATLVRKPSARLLLTPPSLTSAVTAAASSANGLQGIVRVDPPRAVPAFSFEDADGTRHDLREFVGRAVLLNLWATWCGPCVAELPSLAGLSRRAENAGIVVLPLSVDRGGAARVRAFFASHGIDGLPTWNNADGTAGTALALRGVPTTLLIDRQGREVARLEGAADWNTDSALDTLRSVLR